MFESGHSTSLHFKKKIRQIYMQRLFSVPVMHWQRINDKNLFEEILVFFTLNWNIGVCGVYYMFSQTATREMRLCTSGGRTRWPPRTRSTGGSTSLTSWGWGTPRTCWRRRQVGARPPATPPPPTPREHLWCRPRGLRSEALGIKLTPRLVCNICAANPWIPLHQ